MPNAVPSRAAIDWGALDAALLVAWVLGSAVMLVRIGVAVRALHLARAGGPELTIAGERVTLTGDVGPGAIGFGQPRIVAPHWVTSLTESQRALLVRHESEHLAAGDPAMWAAALLALVAAPWNVPLWFQLRRLRAAMELDCDARVLATGGDVRAYGELLLAVASRRPRVALATVLTFAEPRSSLERRIRTMSDRVHTPTTARRVALGALGLAALAVACEARRPDPIAPVTSYTTEGGVTRARTASDTTVVAGESRQRFPLDAAIAAAFPSLDPTVRSDSSIVFIVSSNQSILYARRGGPLPSGGTRSATPAEFPVAPEQIESVEVIKRGDMLPPAVGGGLILITLKQGESLGKVPSPPATRQRS